MKNEINQFIKKSVESELNMLFTGSDESSVLKIFQQVMAFMPPEERVVSIECDHKVDIDHKNLVSLPSKEWACKQSDCLEFAIRMGPGKRRILVNELGEGSFQLMQAMTTGIEGSVAWMVSNDAKTAVQQIENNIKTQFELGEEPIRRMINEAIDLVFVSKGETTELGYITYKKGDLTFEFIKMYEWDNTKTKEWDVPLKEVIKEKFALHELKANELDEQEQKIVFVPKTEDINEIDHQEFRELVKERFVFESWERLRPLLKETISMVRTVKKDEDISIGTSKFGGSPDLPRDVMYPYYTKDVAYSFIMQIDCKEMAKFDETGTLPKDGLLSFFHAFEDGCVILPWDFEDEQDYEGYLKSVKIFYYKGEKAQLERKVIPDNEHIEFIQPALIHYVKNVTLPHLFEEKEVYIKAGFDDTELKEMEKTLDIIREALPRLSFEKPKEVLDGKLDYFYNKPFQQLLGHPYSIQGSPSKNLSYELSDLFAQQTESEKKWVLLAQVENDEGLNLLWAGDGSMFYYIKEEDLKDHSFCEVYAVMQCG